ncbi:hypothetical protein O181_111445 [Austropuccinia psidii MF-1]|uniref:Integrase catalytic domain-containing protein n=1 Tax=Austropuccinia psidii MF-1 TaxID=1389203 RepID=A0A9Q3PSI5_9BASI|nr:hypothetical protein [Austropuccinia psidii MF-1]
MNRQFSQLSKSQGLIHVFAPCKTPQRNGFAERNNHTIPEKACCLLNASNLPKHYCTEAINTSTFLCNIITTASRHNLSPHVLWRGCPAQIKHLKKFGCWAISIIPNHHREWKLSPAAEEGIFLGYENNNTAYCILWSRDRKVIVTKHVTFHGLIFPSLDHSLQPLEPLLIL